MSSFGEKRHQGSCILGLMIVATTIQHFSCLNRRIWSEQKLCVPIKDFEKQGYEKVFLRRGYQSVSTLKSRVKNMRQWRYLSKWHRASPGTWSRPHNEVGVEACAIFRTRRRRPRQERHLSGTHLKDKHKVLFKRKPYANKSNRSLQKVAFSERNPPYFLPLS